MASFGAALAFALTAVTAAASEPSVQHSGWSRPATITSTSVEARPALLVDAHGRMQIFYLDRDAGRGIIRWVTAGLDGRILSGPRTLGEADLRARSLAAAHEGSGIRVIWVAPSGNEMRVQSTRLSEADAASPPQSLTDPVEDAGPVSLAPSAGAHAAWSQASLGRRTVWYERAGFRPVEVARGDAPGLSVGPHGPWIVWWQRAGFDTYRLVAAPVHDAGDLVHALTGNVATSRLHPPAVAHDAAGRLQVMFGTELRGFGPSAGRLSLLEVGLDGRASSRMPVAQGSPFASGPVVARWQGTVAFAWTDLRSGRSRNPEIYVGLRMSPGLEEHRLTYTLAASIHPTLAPGPGAALTAAWLEVVPAGRFKLQFASTARPAPRRLLLDIPELDVYRPAESAAFALTALLATLPYSVMVTLATTLLTAAALAAGRAVFGDSRGWAWLAASSSRAALGALGVALACHSAVTAVIPVIPRLPAPAGAAVLLLVGAWLHLRRPGSRSTLQQAALVMAVILLTSVALAFSQMARALSQLAT